jgi:hypothetical protein
MPHKLYFISFTLMKPGVGMKNRFLVIIYEKSIHMHDENFVLFSIQLCQQENSFL